ncbi:MmgE/PrpD family protein [Castellaniella sp.]|uniref:MmgE/PrpD family protein n=1 Tax=Castellaniella sp. TaxID=1955812 RepID=UPI0035695007
MTSSLTQPMARFVAQLQYDDLPPDVVAQAGRFLLDALGCAFAAYKEDPRKAQIANALVGQFGAAAQATVIGGAQTHAALAALANGMLINAADNDDTHKRALAHLGSVVVPAALAVCEARRGTGRDLITALVAGYEVGARVGMAVMPSHYRFWHSTATNGTFAAAAAAARAAGLGADATCTALGFAGTQAAGLNTFFESGDDSKSLHPGKAAMNGTLAMLLAELGASSPPDILGHPKGYLAAYSTEPDAAALHDGLGERWEILQNGFKFYPSILASHSPIGAALEIVRRDHPAAQDITAVEIRTYATVKSHFSSKDVQKTMAARLSVPYCVAVALVDGEVTQKQFAPERFNDPRVRRVLGVTEVVADPELTPLYPEKFPARVIVTLRDGSRHEATVYYPKGDPGNPLSAPELEQKFRDNGHGVLNPGQADRLVALIGDLENAPLASLSALIGGH